MSTKELSFALDQNKLPPYEQLTLIVISDSCGDFFTLDEARDVVLKHTSLTEIQASAMLFCLCESGFLRVKKIHANPQKEEYFIMVQ